MPFASELGLPPNSGDPEAGDLRSVGFQVYEAYDQQVSVATMASLSSYNVVYMHTHTGVGADGTGVVATGELAGGDPSVQPYLTDGSVVAVGVAGSNQTYYAITDRFVQRHMAPFSSSSFLFINGCALLSAPNFWQALSLKNVGALISWDNDSRTYDDYFSGAAFFNQMDQGLSVSAALSSLYAAGYGTSSYNGQNARLGYVGNGSVTLALAASGVPPAPSATPTNTLPPAATPTSTSTATSTPTSTATVAPTLVPPTATSTPTSTPTPTATAVPLAAPTLKSAVKPGKSQTIDIHGADAGSNAALKVTFPNGDVEARSAAVDAAGSASFTFVQGASKITRRNKTAEVVVDAVNHSRPEQLKAEYAISFAPLDVSVEPRDPQSGSTVSIWVHTRPRARVGILVRLPAFKSKSLKGKTGAEGWAHLHYRLPSSVPVDTKLVLRAEARHHGHLDHSATTAIVSSL